MAPNSRQTSDSTLRPWGIAISREKETLTATGLLEKIEGSLSKLREFFEFDRADIIKIIDESSDALEFVKSILLPEKGAPSWKLLLHSLLIVYLTSLYYATYPDLDTTKKREWWDTNPGYRSGGKAPDFVRDLGFPSDSFLRPVRRALTTGSKLLLAMTELNQSGITLVLMPFVRKLDHLPYLELKRTCDLLPTGRYPNISRACWLYSDDMDKLRNKSYPW
jgi:hypothetical protein